MKSYHHQLLQEIISGPVSTDITPTNTQTAVQEFRSKYSQGEQWRLLVDGIQYAKLPYSIKNNLVRLKPRDKQGWLAYEAREPGSMKAFLSSWQYCLYRLESQAKNTPLTKEFIIDLHAKVSHEVDCADLKDNEIRDIDVAFSLDSKALYRYTKEGWKDLWKFIFSTSSEVSREQSVNFPETGKRDERFLEDQHEEAWYTIEKSNLTYCPPQSADVPDLVQKTIKAYNKAIVCAENADAKLIIIGKTIEAFERIHPFKDGNGRTFVNLLLNYLLLQEGFPPATFFEPNVFDAYDDGSGQTLLKVIKKGMENTLKIYHGEENLFDFNAVNNVDIAVKMHDILSNANIQSTIYRLEDIHAKLDLNNPETIIKDIKKEIITLMTDNTFSFLYQVGNIKRCCFSDISELLNKIVAKLNDKELNQQLEILKNTPLSLINPHCNIDSNLIRYVGKEILSAELREADETVLLKEFIIYNQTVDNIFNQENIQNALLTAVQRGCDEQVKVLLEDVNFDPNTGNKFYSLLSCAVNNNMLKIANLLLSHPHIDPNVESENGFTPLMEAVLNKDIKMVKTLLQHPRVNANFQSIKGGGATAIFIAAHEGSIDIAGALLKSGVDINLTFTQDESSFRHLANSKGVTEQMNLFIQKKLAEGQLASAISITPIELANITGHTEMVKLFESHQKVKDKNDSSYHTSFLFSQPSIVSQEEVHHAVKKSNNKI